MKDLSGIKNSCPALDKLILMLRESQVIGPYSKEDMVAQVEIARDVNMELRRWGNELYEVING